MTNANETGEDKGGDSQEGADDQDLDLKDDEGDDADDDAGDDKGDKGKDGKKTPETPEAKRARLQRELKQLDKKHPPSDEKPKPSASKKGDLDYGQKAFLIASGIKGEAETTLVQDYVKDSGKSIESVLANKAFLADLKDLRDSDSASDAIPDSKRSGNTSRDSVEYWISKGELPPNTPENTELRRKVVAAKMAKAKGGSPFTSNPVVQ